MDGLRQAAGKSRRLAWEESPARSRLEPDQARAAVPARKASTPTIPPTRAEALIAHASPVMRLGLATIVDSHPSFRVCAETDEAPMARELFLRHTPDLVVLGLTLRHGDGIALIKELRKLEPATRTLVVTRRDDALAVQRAFRAGACGYLLVGDDTSEILTAIERIMAGERYASAKVARRLLETLATGLMKPEGSKVTSLSDRELQIFSLFGRGFGVTRLAEELRVSVKTVETHQMRIRQKLGLRSAAELSKEATLWVSEVARHELATRR